MKSTFRRIPSLLLQFVLLISLVACRSGGYRPIDPPNLPCKDCAASDKAIAKMQQDLDRNGVRVITMGQDYLVSIPATALFANQSPRILWPSYALLNDVVCYLQQFRKIAVNVTAFSDKCVSPKREAALTRTRARAVGEYLWSQGIDSRFVFTEGLGNDKPIMRFSQCGKPSANERIEISFRRAVA